MKLSRLSFQTKWRILLDLFGFPRKMDNEKPEISEYTDKNEKVIVSFSKEVNESVLPPKVFYSDSLVSQGSSLPERTNAATHVKKDSKKHRPNLAGKWPKAAALLGGIMVLIGVSVTYVVGSVFLRSNRKPDPSVNATPHPIQPKIEPPALPDGKMQITKKSYNPKTDTTTIAFLSNRFLGRAYILGKLHDSFTWKYGKTDRINEPGDPVAILERIVKKEPSPPVASILIGTASFEGTDDTERGRAKERIKTMHGWMKGIYPDWTKTYGYNLGRNNKPPAGIKWTPEATRAQRHLIFMEIIEVRRPDADIVRDFPNEFRDFCQETGDDAPVTLADYPMQAKIDPLDERPQRHRR